MRTILITEPDLVRMGEWDGTRGCYRFPKAKGRYFTQKSGCSVLAVFSFLFRDERPLCSSTSVKVLLEVCARSSLRHLDVAVDCSGVWHWEWLLRCDAGLQSCWAVLLVLVRMLWRRQRHHGVNCSCFAACHWFT